jgi:hypothetical protein
MQVDMFEHRLRTGDTLLLCSDGLSNLIPDPELAAVLSEHVPQQAVQALVDMANERGGPDNITAVAARVVDLPAGLGEERPEMLTATTTQPVRLDREQIEAAASAEAARAEEKESPAPQAAPLAARHLRSRLSPRRRATILLAVITLIALLAIVTLIALRADKISEWLAWPTPVSLLLLRIPVQGMHALPGVMLTPALLSLVRTCAASP